MKEIPLTKGKIALVDDEDFEWLSVYSWQFHNKGYANRIEGWKKGNRHHILMHRQIMQPPNGLVVDHINGNRLDNRRSNLRICEYWQNGKNRIDAKPHQSKYRGVYLINGRWQAILQVNLGLYRTEEEAAIAHQKAITLYKVALAGN